MMRRSSIKVFFVMFALWTVVLASCISIVDNASGSELLHTDGYVADCETVQIWDTLAPLGEVHVFRSDGTDRYPRVGTSLTIRTIAENGIVLRIVTENTSYRLNLFEQCDFPVPPPVSTTTTIVPPPTVGTTTPPTSLPPTTAPVPPTTAPPTTTGPPPATVPPTAPPPPPSLPPATPADPVPGQPRFTG